MTNSSAHKIAKQKEMAMNRGREEVNVALEKKKAEGEVIRKMKEGEREEEEESEVIWEAVNFALEQLNLDSRGNLLRSVPSVFLQTFFEFSYFLFISHEFMLHLGCI